MKKLNIEEMKNMSIDDIVGLYREGYRLKGDNMPYISSMGEQKLENADVYSMQDPLMILYGQSYLQPDGNMTVDLLVRNRDGGTRILLFKVYDVYPVQNPTLLFQKAFCIPNYSEVSNANGCTKIRMTNIAPFKDPIFVRMHRCIANCNIPTCTGTFEEYPTDTYGLASGEGDGWFINMGDTPYTVPTEIFGEPYPIPPSINLAIECRSCDPSWTCVKDIFNRNTGDKYDSCTQQTARDTVMCPLPPIPMSQISISANKSSPFNKGDIVMFYGTLRSAVSPYPNIVGASVSLLIKLGIAEVTQTDTIVTTTSATSGTNWSYSWTVPPTTAGVDTAGMNVKVIAQFGGNADFQPSTETQLYGIAGVTCTDLMVTPSKTVATQGDGITLTAVTNPPGFMFPVVIKANNIPVAPIPSGQQGQCTTIPSLSSSLSSLPYEYLSYGNIYALQNVIAILNPPTVVMPGQVIGLKINYDVTVAGFPGDYVRIRICDTTPGKPVKEIGDARSWAWGRTTQTVSISTKIPTDASGAITLRAEMSSSAWDGQCGSNVLVQSIPVTITVSKLIKDSIILLTEPSTVVTGQKLDFKITYDLPSVAWTFVLFRICSDSGVLGYNDPFLIGSKGNVTVSTNIPSITETINLWAEITADQNAKAVCGDALLVAKTAPIPVKIISQDANTLNFVDLPIGTTAGQTVDINMSYYITGLSSGGQVVRFRICSAGYEIGHSKLYLSGTASGVATVSMKVPEGAVTHVTIKGEATTNDVSAACGDAEVKASTVTTPSIPIFATVPGLCSVIWDTNKWYNPQVENSPWPAGTYYITGAVLGKCVTKETVIVELQPRRLPCTRVSLGIDKIEPKIGDEILLIAVTEPITQSYEATFKLDNKAIGITCTTSAGRCATATKWKIPTDLSIGNHELTAEIIGPTGAVECKSISITIPVTAPVVNVGAAIFVVVCGGVACEGASIINAATGKPIGTTAIDGKVKVSNLPTGTFNFKVAKSGYNDGSGSVTIIKDTTTTASTVTLTTSTAGTGTISFTVNTDGDPLAGTAVTLISDRLRGTTDSSGVVEFPGLTLASSHTYKVEKSGYNTVEGTVDGAVFTTSPKNVPINMILYAPPVTPTPAAGAAVAVIGAAALGLAYLYLRGKE